MAPSENRKAKKSGGYADGEQEADASISPEKRNGETAPASAPTQGFTETSSAASAECGFTEGQWVALHGLSGAAYLNDEIGVITSRLDANGRLAVRVNGKPKSIKPANLRSISDEEITCYEIVPFAGKGLGVVARKHITKYSTIMIDRPALQIQGFSHGMVHDEKEFDRKFKELPDAMQKQVMELQGGNLAGILKTNAFGGRADTSTGKFSGGTLFLKFSRLNHSCSPNAEFKWNELQEDACVYALKDIEVGETITIAYVDVLEDARTRNMMLMRYGFKCDCAHCTNPGPLDAKRVEVLRALDVEERTLAQNQKQIANLKELGLNIPYIEVNFTRGMSVNHLHAGNYDESIAAGVEAIHCLTKVQGAKSPLVKQLKEIVAEAAKRKKDEL